MDSSNTYLKILDDFCRTAQLPASSTGIIYDKPWLIKEDPLHDFLISIMSDKHYQKQVAGSRLRAKVFYSSVGKFIAEITHYEQFQNQRAWTERNNMQKVLEWSPIKKANKDARQNLLEDIAARHSSYGFSKDFFERIFENGGTLKQQNWEKLTADWENALASHITSDCKAHLYKRKDAFMKGLELIMNQVTRYMCTHSTNEQQAAQAWDMMNGQWTETEFERQLNIVRIQENYPQIGEVAACMGRIADANGKDRLTIASGHTMKMEHSSGSDIEGITTGNDLSSLLPLELAQYSDEDMGDLFIYKYLTRRLQTFRYKSEMSKPSRKLSFIHASRRGPMIICIDTSASMYGTPQRITSSMLALIEETAEMLQRDCFLIDFSISIRPIDLMERRKQKRLMQLGLNGDSNIEFKKGELPFIGGGTCARKLMEEMFNLLNNDKGHYVNADVLLVSDFLIPFPPTEYLGKLKEYRKTGTKFYGLCIKRADDKEPNPWKTMFDNIYEIRYRHLRKY
jgi:uncharacterized protein with von Willebrand factor type A (vWA) domain